MNVDAIHTDNCTALHATSMGFRASGAGAFDAAEDPASGAGDQRLTGIWNGPTSIRHIYPYTLFNKSPLQLRRIGALGGKAYARNQRARRALMPTPAASASVPLRAAPAQTTAEAVALLDAQFPWLSGAEKRRSRKLPPTRFKCAMCRIAR